MTLLSSIRPSDKAEPQISQPSPERLISGQPEFRSWPCTEGQVASGIWQATPGQHRVSRDGAGIEHFYILEGEIELIEDGQPAKRFGAGDLVVIKPHFQGVWHTISTVRKVYLFVTL